MANATLSTEAASLFVKVNPPHGPGTVGGWYITVLAVLVSWSLHPEKRVSDSTSLDFITILTLPAVACGHFMTLVHKQQPFKISDDSPEHWDETLLPERLAAYAPYTLMRSVLAISLMLAITSISTSNRCIDRGCVCRLRPLEVTYHFCIDQACVCHVLASICGGTLLIFSHAFKLNWSELASDREVLR